MPPAPGGLSAKLSDADKRYKIWRSGLGPKVHAITTQPEPRMLGSAARGRQMLAGNFLFAGELASAPGVTIWDVPSPSTRFTDALHDFAWLDDLAALGDDTARLKARAWVIDWIARHGSGAGPIWRPEIAGSRVLRWISHAPFLLRGMERGDSAAFFIALGRQTRYLAHTWRDTPPGLPRTSALIGLLYAGLSLEGADGHRRDATEGLSRICREDIASDGSIPSRNPEELAHILTLLVWAIRTLEETGHSVPEDLTGATARIVPILRALRLAEGKLPHFHGATRGEPGAIERTLAESGVRDAKRNKLSMGYARLAAGRTIALMDAAKPPAEPFAGNAHASTLAFEMSSGRRMMIVNTGPGTIFGHAWADACRATAAHSGLIVNNRSLARLMPARGGGKDLREGPKTVTVERAIDRTGLWMLCSHDGYEPEFGLIHERRLFLAPDGRDLRGEDTLSSQSTRARGTFAAEAQKAGGALPFALRFHLHPDVTPQLDLGGQAVSLALKNGEVWVFRQSGGEIALEASTYLDTLRLRPRATKQIVVNAAANDYSARVNWVFKRTAEGEPHTRDTALAEEEDAAPDLQLP